MVIFVTILQLISALILIAVVLFQSGKSQGLSGAIGGGGLGDVAIRYGYSRWDTKILLATVVLLVILMQIIQIVGSRLSKKLDRRLTH